MTKRVIVVLVLALQGAELLQGVNLFLDILRVFFVNLGFYYGAEKLNCFITVL